MQVAGRAELGGEGRDGEAAPLLAVPDLVLPRFMRTDDVHDFRRAWVGHLGAVLIADAGMDVQAAFGGEAEGLGLVVGQALADVDPVRVVGADLQGGEGLEVLAGVARIEEDAPAVDLVADRQAGLGLAGQGGGEEGARREVGRGQSGLLQILE